MIKIKCTCNKLLENGIYIYIIKAINIHRNNALYYSIILVLGDLKTI